MLKQLSLVVVFSIVGFCAMFTQNVNAQVAETFETLEECQEAYSNGLFRIYQSRFRGKAYKVKGLPTANLPGFACVKQDVVNGVGANARYTIQDKSIKFVIQNGVITHRADCGNKVYDVVFLEKKEVGYQCPDDSKWDPVKKKCMVDGELAVNCEKGKWNEAQQKCVVTGEESIVCEKKGYKYDTLSQKCVYVAEIQECPEDKLWDAKKRKCVKQGGGIPWKWIGIGAAAVGGTILVVKLVDHDDCKTCPVIATKTTPANSTGTGGRPGVLAMFEKQNGQYVLSNSSSSNNVSASQGSTGSSNVSASQGNASNGKVCGTNSKGVYKCYND